MKAVWSFWTKPYSLTGRGRWYSDFHHWLAWGLSLYAARRFYPETCLITDDAGARVLIDELQLPFEQVTTELNRIHDQDPEWWALGKLEAYRLQAEPFVHLDPDVFLWKPLAIELETADIFTQNPLPVIPGVTFHQPAELEEVLGHPSTGWLPKEWVWYRRQQSNQRAECCGVVGGTRYDFISDYANSVLRLVNDPRNSDSFRTSSRKAAHMFLIEEYILTACLEYHRRRRRSPFYGIEIRHMFPTLEDAYNPEYTTHSGFSHLAGPAKKDSRLARGLEKRVRHDLPRFYERCLDYRQSSERES
jgi:hypothetical protein